MMRLLALVLQGTFLCRLIGGSRQQLDGFWSGHTLPTCIYAHCSFIPLELLLSFSSMCAMKKVHAARACFDDALTTGTFGAMQGRVCCTSTTTHADKQRLDGFTT